MPLWPIGMRVRSKRNPQREGTIVAPHPADANPHVALRVLWDDAQTPGTRWNGATGMLDEWPYAYRKVYRSAVEPIETPADSRP